VPPFQSLALHDRADAHIAAARRLLTASKPLGQRENELRASSQTQAVMQHRTFSPILFGAPQFYPRWEQA
jgi:hypothetical protein